MFKMSKVIYTLVFAVVLFSCDPRTSDSGSEIRYKVQPAPEWTALFKRSSGWFGGDGIFAIPFTGADKGGLANDSILFVFSDTMVGEIKDGVLQPGFAMVNNSVMTLHGSEPLAEKAHFQVNHSAEKKPVSLFVPATPNTQKDDYYWLGDGFVDHAKDNNLYIFAYRIRNTNDGSMFPFREVGGALLIIPRNSKFPFKESRQLDLPFPSSDQDMLSTSFGVGVFVNTDAAGAAEPDGFIYIYGVRGKTKELVAARVKAGSLEDFSAWEFRAGDAWSKDLKQASALADSVSNELSVTPIGNNQYALIYQHGGIFPDISMQIGPTPFGPFGPRKTIWNTTAEVSEKDLFTYNAKAHPALSKPGELLVSYNVNSFKFADQIKQIPDLYRPRFIKIIFDKE
jgi:hypothetical protein